MRFTDREACVVLNMLSGVGAVKFEHLCQLYGTAGAIFEQSEACLAAIPAIGEKLANKIANWHKFIDFDKESALVERAGVDIIAYTDEAYPAPLKELNDFPLCLYVRGKMPDFNQPTLAVVGSRRISTYGRRMVDHLTSAASHAGWTIVSGLAYGVDAAAHQACLSANGCTVAVLGGGLTRIHPQDHIPMARQITENGAVITEFPMTYAPNKTSFPMRNRIISGLSQAVLVVEAGFKSGSLITANFALEQGRSVFAVPGRVENPQSRGCHALIKQGAKLTESFEDILEDFEFFPGFAGLFNATTSSEKDVSLPDDEQAVVDCLIHEEKSVDMLAVDLGLDVGALLALLMKMEMKKLVRQSPGNVYSVY